MSTVDGHGNPLDGAKSYRLRVPANVAARDFGHTSSTAPGHAHSLDTEEIRALSKDALQTNADGSVDIYLGPKPPEGRVTNWLATGSTNGFSPAPASTGPTETLTNKVWKLSDFEEAGIDRT